MIKMIKKTVEETLAGLQFVIVVLPDHTDSLFGTALSKGSHSCRTNQFGVER